MPNAAATEGRAPHYHRSRRRAGGWATSTRSEMGIRVGQVTDATSQLPYSTLLSVVRNEYQKNRVKIARAFATKIRVSPTHYRM